MYMFLLVVFTKSTKSNDSDIQPKKWDNKILFQSNW